VSDLILLIRADALNAEIVIVDDGSTEFSIKNKQINEYDEVRYFEFKENKGRSLARNFLAEQAKYQYLLFIDCDAEVAKNDFLTTYYRCIVDKKDVVCGGLMYPKKEDVKKEHYLRWYYGTKREERPLNKRKEFPYRSFSSFNFMIRKEIFLKIKFPKQINTYGHEDTFLGLALEATGINIEHINNPLIHLGLENAEVFIEKSKISVQNMDKLAVLVADKEKLIFGIKMYRYINIVKKLHIQWIIRFLYYLSNHFLFKNLTSNRPNLRLFDFYKLGYYFNLKK